MIAVRPSIARFVALLAGLALAGWIVFFFLGDGHPFGSSLDDRDFADRNVLIGNLFRYPFHSIRDDGRDNRITP